MINDGCNSDIMTKNANEQKMDSLYQEFDRDIMTKNALENEERTQFFTCRSCGDLQRWKSHCDKCGT
ncbi:unnamed protein product, partial [marine sediment metagenome]